VALYNAFAYPNSAKDGSSAFWLALFNKQSILNQDPDKRRAGGTGQREKMAMERFNLVRMFWQSKFETEAVFHAIDSITLAPGGSVFPTLGESLRRGWVTSTNNYEIALNGMRVMVDALTQPPDKRLSNEEVLDKLGKWFESGLGKAKLVSEPQDSPTDRNELLFKDAVIAWTQFYIMQLLSASKNNARYGLVEFATSPHQVGSKMLEQARRTDEFDHLIEEVEHLVKLAGSKISHFKTRSGEPLGKAVTDWLHHYKDQARYERFKNGSLIDNRYKYLQEWNIVIHGKKNVGAISKVYELKELWDWARDLTRPMPPPYPEKGSHGGKEANKDTTDEQKH
jgi:hypothetical protein